MRTFIAILFITLLTSLVMSPLLADIKTSKEGDVRVPLTEYQNLLDQLRLKPTPSPPSYAIGKSNIQVSIIEHRDFTSAEINVKLTVEVFDNVWTSIPILPYGAAISSFLVNGVAAQLVQGNEWLSWSTNKRGITQLLIRYNVDAVRSDSGFTLPLPVPKAAATLLTLQHPGKNLDLAVIPSADLKLTQTSKHTNVTAKIPTTSSVLISWRLPTKQFYIISRAFYKGEVQKEAILWKAEFTVEVFTGESVELELMPSSVTLNNVLINKKLATLKVEKGKFVALVQGRGNYNVQVAFQVPIEKLQGPPQASLFVPKVPVSKFELRLPGKKELKVTPTTNIVSRIEKNFTHATIYAPLTDQVTFSWSDAIPDDLKSKLKANANVYHTIHAEEGVLHARAVIAYDITHGETSNLSFYLPASVQVNHIQSTDGGVSDWIVDDTKDKKIKLISVFLDRAVQGKYSLSIQYEQLTKKSTTDSEIKVPLLRVAKTHRQRGMIAILSGPELALKPVLEKNISKVGENQLPAFVKNNISLTIAHTYKYTGGSPILSVSAITPERKEGKFDVQIDTLISLGEVTMKGSASLEIDIKSGTIAELNLIAPTTINVLNVTGPSIRTYKISSDTGKQTIRLEFTQQMQGQFRIHIGYEKILADKTSQLDVPTISVPAAEVEHGRIAVEALTAVEVRASIADQLSSIDVNELPQQLVLKTSNPILLAYKYVYAEPPYKLVLKMTRHQELNVQVAAIENAHYQTLITDDGLAVTTAKFWIRNSRQQFLRLLLPGDSEIWSVFVNNKAEKPAKASDASDELNAILIKMINSSTGFMVEVVYATTIEKMTTFGRISSNLPQPDMVVTRSKWNVYMPAGPNYHGIDTNMNIVTGGDWVNPLAHVTRDKDAIIKVSNATQALRIKVPSEGIHFAFEKLYANRSDDVATFTIRYTSAAGDELGIMVSVVGVILIWLSLFLLKLERATVSREIKLSLLVIGVCGLLVSIGYFETSMTTASSVAIAGGIAYLLILITAKIKQWRMNRVEEG